MSTHPKFTASKFETAIIRQIAVRAADLAQQNLIDWRLADIVMDLEAAHCNGCDLDLNRLLAAPEADFGHDVFGIRHYLDRTTGQLDKSFCPRTAL